MKVELTIRLGWNKTKVIIEGYEPMVEKLREAVKKSAKEYSDYVEVK